MSARFVIVSLITMSAIFFHFTGTEMPQRLDFFHKQQRLLSDSTSSDLSKAGADKSKKNCAVLLALPGGKGEVLPRCLRWRPSQILIMSYVNNDFHGCQWECINFQASLGRRAHLLHRRCDTCVHTHTHIHTNGVKHSVSQLSTHNYALSHTRTSSYCLKYKQIVCGNTFFYTHTHTYAYTCTYKHTHTIFLCTVYVAAGWDYEFKLPVSFSILLLPNRASCCWVSAIKK